MRPGMAYGECGPLRPAFSGTSSSTLTSFGFVGSSATLMRKIRLEKRLQPQMWVRSSVKPKWCVSLPDEPRSS